MIYAINKRTKEHRVYRIGCDVSMDPGWRLVEADADGWISWDGRSVSPVPTDSEFEVWLRSGVNGSGLLGKWVHGRTDMHFDIIAYRPILDADEPAEPEAVEWDGEGLPP